MKDLGYLIAAVLICGAVFTSCDKNEENERAFIVSFDSNGGSEVQPQTVREGEKAIKPEINPILDGYTFVAWRKDVELKTKWQFDTEMVTLLRQGSHLVFCILAGSTCLRKDRCLFHR